MTEAQMRIGLIACCKTKLATRAPAKELYVSDLFKKSRAYVERYCDSWAILSAEHGLVMPDDEIEPYEKTLDGMPAGERQAWANNVEGQLRERFGDLVTLVVIAGKRYRAAVAGMPRVETPFGGLGIGELKRALLDAVAGNGRG